METPPPALVEDEAEAVPPRQAEFGFTLQTLIVTAAVVLMAAVAATVLWGVTRGARDNAEDAGRVGTEARCAPNEVRDPDLESKGRKGSNRILDAEITADAIGCYPVCGTWEYYDPGLAAAGTGGPDGGSGIYSSDIGCFAPCYWNHKFPPNMWRPDYSQAVSDHTWLSYYDDNRPPGINQIRLGVNYRRRPFSEIASPAVGGALLVQANDLMIIFVPDDGPTPGLLNETADRKPYIHTRTSSVPLVETANSLSLQHGVPQSDNFGGSRFYAGELPLHPKQIAYGLPTVFKPNWITRPTPVEDPGREYPELRNDGNWEDENWEYRADPYKEVCTIVNITENDKVVCSSEWEDCRHPYEGGPENP